MCLNFSVNPSLVVGTLFSSSESVSNSKSSKVLLWLPCSVSILFALLRLALYLIFGFIKLSLPLPACSVLVSSALLFKGHSLTKCPCS